MNPTAVVTGATKGIGKAIITLLAEHGFDLAFNARDPQAVKALESSLKELYPNQNFMGVSTDMSMKTEVLKFAKEVVEIFREVDMLVNNAGLFVPGPLLEEEDGVLEQMIDTNLYSAYHLSRAIAPLMISKKHGHIFNICSVASLKAYPNGGSYSISKFAMLGLSKSLREELKDHHIRVSSVMPGATYTASWEGVEIPEDRFMPAEDIAKSIWDVYNLSHRTVVEDIVLRPQLGDI